VLYSKGQTLEEKIKAKCISFSVSLEMKSLSGCLRKDMLFFNIKTIFLVTGKLYEPSSFFNFYFKIENIRIILLGQCNSYV